MQHILQAPTMTALHEAMCEKLLYSHKLDYDYITGTDVIFEHVWAEAQSMDWECDISRFWLTKARWNMMVKQYLNEEAVRAWVTLIVQRVDKKHANRVVLRTNTVTGGFRGNATTRALGSCMLSVSFSLQTQPTILLHSRTGYLGYLSPLDMSIAYHCGRLAADAIGLDITDFRFIWFCETIQYHQFRTIAYPLGDSESKHKFLTRARELRAEGSLKDYPALDRNLEQYIKWNRANKQGIGFYDLSSYSSYQRPRKRWVTQEYGVDFAKTLESDRSKAFPVLPHLDVKQLKLDKIGFDIS